jgi:hypothetical protein
MVLTFDVFGYRLPAFRADAHRVQPARTDAAAPAERAFPMLFQLRDRRSGQVARLQGQPIDWVGTSLAEAREELLHNRDPRHFEVVIASPNMVSVD